MKPPPRKRTKPDRTLDSGLPPRHKAAQWQRAEQKNLLKALKALRSRRGGLEDIDCVYLRKYVPTRSVSEINSVVEYLKNKVISLANLKLKKKIWMEKKARKPIEVWTHLASAIAGTLEEPISTAFSQMLVVSSTEPRTLRNCDPPQVYRPPTDQNRPVGRTVPFRPMPRLPVKADPPGTNTAHPVKVLKTPGPTMGPAKRLPAKFQVLRVSNSKIPSPQKLVSTTAGTLLAATSTTTTTTTTTSQSAAPSCQPGVPEILNKPATSAQPASRTGTPVTGQVSPSSGSAAVVKTQSVGSSLIQTTQHPSEQHPTTSTSTSTPTSKSISSGPHTSSSATGQNPVPSTAPSSGASSACPRPPLSSPASEFHAKFGRTSKHATNDSPRMFGVKSVVDFERIYRYLSVIHQPNEKCHLTPMESAIVLDLLMSLPEELPLLDCNKLHKHLVKMYQFLTTTADTKTTGEMFRELKDGLCAQTKAPSGPDTAGSADRGDAADRGGKKLQPDEAEIQSSSGNSNPSDQSGGADEMGRCPPLNPFMVPLKLLMRK